MHCCLCSVKKKKTSALLPKISAAGQTESELSVTQSVFVHLYIRGNVYKQGIYQLPFLNATQLAGSNCF